MSNNNEWISDRIAEASEQNPLVTEIVMGRIAQLLNGQLSERQLPSAELKSVAETLIGDMVPVSLTPEPTE